MTNAEVGKRIKMLREGKKLNRNELANLAGVSPTYIYQLEKGEKSPTVEYLGYICDALQVSLYDFFGIDQSDEQLKNRVDSLSLRQKELLNNFLESLF